MEGGRWKVEDGSRKSESRKLKEGRWEMEGGRWKKEEDQLSMVNGLIAKVKPEARGMKLKIEV